MNKASKSSELNNLILITFSRRMNDNRIIQWASDVRPALIHIKLNGGFPATMMLATPSAQRNKVKMKSGMLRTTLLATIAFGLQIQLGLAADVAHGRQLALRWCAAVMR